MEGPALNPLHSVWLTAIGDAGTQAKAVVDHLLRRNNVHEPSLRVFSILNHPSYQLGKVPLCLDLGANQGQSIISLSNVCPRLSVISFEPLPWCVSSLEYLASKSDALPQGFSFTIVAEGLSDSEKQIQIWIPGSPTHMLTSMASIDRSRIDNPGVKTYMERFFVKPLDQITAHSANIKINRLDNFELLPSGIKLDIEEHELSALRGAEKTLGTSHPLLVIETGYQKDEIANFLAGYGYQRFMFDEQDQKIYAYGTRSLNGNTIFLVDRHLGIAKAINLLG